MLLQGEAVIGFLLFCILFFQPAAIFTRCMSKQEEYFPYYALKQADCRLFVSMLYYNHQACGKHAKATKEAPS